jgi:hypothetical protein
MVISTSRILPLRDIPENGHEANLPENPTYSIWLEQKDM